MLTLVILACFVVTWGLGEMLVFSTNRHADGDAMLSVADLQKRFTGGHKSLLEAQVSGPMRQYLDNGKEAATLIGWVRAGADEESYRQDVAALVDDRCVRCHRMGGEAAFRPLTSYADLRAASQAAPAPSFRGQLLVTKVHVVGLGLLLAVTALLFLRWPGPESLARWQSAIVAAAFAGLLLDFGSWWLMRVDLAFAWGRLLGNTLMSGSFLWMCACAALGAIRGHGRSG